MLISLFIAILQAIEDKDGTRGRLTESWSIKKCLIFCASKKTHRQALQQVAGLDSHMKRDIGMNEIEGADIHSDPILLLSRGPFERYAR